MNTYVETEQQAEQSRSRTASMSSTTSAINPIFVDSESEPSLSPPDQEAIAEAVAEDEALQQRVLEESFMLSSDSNSSGFEHHMAEADLP